MSRSTWACELKLRTWPLHMTVWQSRSTWACELKCLRLWLWQHDRCHAPRKRVSWNLQVLPPKVSQDRHAPRERVSWNFPRWGNFIFFPRHAPRERVSWNKKFMSSPCRYPVTLHVSVWVEILFVSFSALSRPVTLHVSVWVEILVMIILLSLPWSRSTWACELKSELLRGADHREAVTLHVRIWLVICMSRILRCVVYIVFS